MPDNKLNHYIYIGPHGTFAPSGKNPVSTSESIDALFADMVRDNCQHMVVYFHGGMVSRVSGETSATGLDPMFRAIGAQPVFFIWETDPLVTIRQNVSKLVSSELFQDLLKYILGQVVKRWAGVSILGKGPGVTMDFDEIGLELEKDRPFDEVALESDALGGAKGGLEPVTEDTLAQAEEEMQNELAVLMGLRTNELEAAMIEAADNDLLSDEIRQDGADTTAKGFDLLALVKLAVKVGIRVLRRYKDGLDHGPYPTTIEELLREVGAGGVGKFLWDSMKEKAEAMWQPNPDSLPVDSKDAHVGSYFLEGLVKYASGHANFKIDLVGHSAGSIVICHLLAAAAVRYPSFRFGHIALLAPAARMDLFHKEIVSHPERFDRLRMFTMKEEIELKDAIAGRFYPLSLVFFVSGLLEDSVPVPLCGLARCLSGAEPYGTGLPFQVHQYMCEPNENRLVLSITDAADPPGLRSNAQHHGDFDNVRIRDEASGEEEKVLNETIPSLQIFFKRTP